MARAKFTTYDQEVMKEASVQSTDHTSREQQYVYPQQTVPTNITVAASAARTDVSYLAQAIQDSIALNRLSIPEPSVFTGDSIQLIELKASFTSIIDKKNIASADELHYLKKNVGCVQLERHLMAYFRETMKRPLKKRPSQSTVWSAL